MLRTRSKTPLASLRLGSSAIQLAIGYLVAIVIGWSIVGATANGWESEPGIWIYVLEGALIGAVVSSFQWIAMRNPGVSLLWFALAGSFGLALAWPIGEIVSDPAGWVVSFVIFGIGIGAGQLMVLRRVPLRPTVWVVLSSVAWMSSSLPVVSESFEFILLFLCGALVFGLVSALTPILALPNGRRVTGG